MKKFRKVVGLTLAVLLVGILAYVYVSFNFYSPADPEVEIDAKQLAYYNDSWEECRNNFIGCAERMKTRFDSVEIFSIPVASKTDDDLTIDFCYIPAADTTKKLMVINSGIHGIEGFVGSAVQQMLMTEFFQPEMVSEIGILIVHGMNAWGFKNERRFSENNVDLNRNFSLDKSLFETKNDGFIALYDMLTPKGEVNMGSIKNQFFMLTAIKQIAQKGMPALLQAFAQGQYQFQEGIYFGGYEFEQQVAIMSKVLKDKSEPYTTVFSIDLHTGFGERGELHLFPNPVEDQNVRQKMETIFEGHQINWGDSDNFYTVHGQFVEFIADLLPGKISIPMVMEFGTLNTSKTVGSVKSAHISIVENQGAHYGYKSEKDSLKAQAGYYEMFYPRSEKWRTNAINISLEMMEDVMHNFQGL
jgi:hypothetical protein